MYPANNETVISLNGKALRCKPHSVEHALRTLIGTCWAHGDRDALNEIAGRVLTHAPSNAEFIDMIAAYIKNGGRHENPMERLARRRLFAFDK